MQYLLLVIIYIIFSFAWYMPLYKKQGMEEKVPRKYYIQGFLWGLIPSFFVAIFAEGGFDYLWGVFGIEENSVLFHILKAVVEYGLCEELSKYLFARISVRKLNSVRKIDMVLLFGIVGMGFELFEGLFYIAEGGIAAVIIRSVLALHIMFQFFMGYYYYDAFVYKQNGDIKGYRRSMAIALAVPILIHGFHDIGGELIVYWKDELDNLSTLGKVSITLFFTSFIIDVIFIIFTLKKVYRSALESRQSEL